MISCEKFFEFLTTIIYLKQAASDPKEPDIYQALFATGHAHTQEKNISKWRVKSHTI